ncbi:GNAT family N-acetyltransferase [Lactococcus petauri]|uniref:GNAT family N-acetyltransferase n=1 Tax=Lactococcus petauri TaxID=1940789 RepID=UPI001F58F6AF|nr:GNAT family N-acetyltransferase [Lactococcus petauri]
MIKQVLEKLEHIQFGSLEQFKESMDNNMKDLVNNYHIAPTEPFEVPTIYQMIRELAIHENENPEDIDLTVDDLEAAIGGSYGIGVPCFTIYAPNHKIVGFALCHLNFGSWQGVSLYLEDFYIRKEHRGGGLGKSVLRYLAGYAVKHNYRCLDWGCFLDNESIGMYRHLNKYGVIEQTNWSCFRLSDDKLEEFAKGA